MHPDQTEAVRRAAQLLGSQRALAQALGVAAVNISQWTRHGGAKGRPVPPKQCVRIERLTSGQVKRQQLRPDDWADIWPELAESQHQEVARG
ncbi:transcriptional regulator [Melaminivora sp.]|uniref:transcriptional regulator n=1 Tax=Melaminivora sp. TaxID=1933032 RepID=UPI0028A7955F|nr:Cro/CI family transcriptional regulator [Melaminivora sp.]